MSALKPHPLGSTTVGVGEFANDDCVLFAMDGAALIVLDPQYTSMSFGTPPIDMTKLSEIDADPMLMSWLQCWRMSEGATVHNDTDVNGRVTS